MDKNNLIPTIKYLLLTVKHKWFVLRAGLKIGAPIWRLLTHDLSKFRLSELPHYGRQFFGSANRPYDFIRCWIRHQNRNDHHWEYWIPRTGHNRCDPAYPDNKPVPMCDGAVKEMIADWMGASRTYEGKWPDSNWPWLKGNFHKIIIHPRTKIKIVSLLKRRIK